MLISDFMDLSGLKQMLKGHGRIFTDCELISFAFLTTRDFVTWDDWFSYINSKVNYSDVTRLVTASISELKELPEGAEAFVVGYVTPERSAVESLREGVRVPREFLLFLSNKGKERPNGLQPQG